MKILKKSLNAIIFSTLIVVIVCLHPTASYSVVLFSDNFDDNYITSQNWNDPSIGVTEEDGILKVQRIVTDQGGWIRSKPFNINSEGVITITRNVKQHFANKFYAGKLSFQFINHDELNFAVEYSTYSYDADIYCPFVGFFLSRYNSNPTYCYQQINLSDRIEPVWDEWFEEKIVYNPATGFVQYYINDLLKITYYVGILPPSVTQMKIDISAWGWYTGHYQYMDNLVIDQGESNEDENGGQGEVYPLETGTWQFYFGPTPNSLVGSHGRIESDAGQWSFIDTYWGENPVIIDQGPNYTRYQNNFQNAILMLNFNGTQYPATSTNGVWYWTVLHSWGEYPDQVVNGVGEATAYIYENGNQYQLDFDFLFEETSYTPAVNRLGNITSAVMTKTQILTGVEEGVWDSVTPVPGYPLIELGTYTNTVKGSWPSYQGTISSSASTGGQWSMINIEHEPAQIVPNSYLEVPMGGITYVYETYTAKLKNGLWTVNYNGRTYHPPVNGLTTYTMVWTKPRSNVTYLGNINISTVYTGEVEEFGIKYEFKQEVSQEMTGAVKNPNTGIWTLSGNVTYIKLTIVSTAPDPIAPDDLVLNDPVYSYDAGLEVSEGELEGAKIIYNSATETVQPMLGTPSNVPDLNTLDANAIGEKLNLQPHGTVFNTPAKIFIPCPGYADVSGLNVYHYNGTAWQMACDAAGNVVDPGGTGWMVPGSRVNHNDTNLNDGILSTIEIKVYHFSAAQAAAPHLAEIAVDFGAGISGVWLWNASSWQQITSFSANQIEPWSKGLLVDLGSPYGQWNFNGTAWDPQLSNLNALGMCGWNNGVAVDFQTYGLFSHNETNWTQLTTLNQRAMTGWNNGLAVDFNIYGLFNYDGLSWYHIANWNTENMEPWSDNLAVDFGSNGLFTRNAANWTLISNLNAEEMVGWANGLAVDFGNFGLWSYNGSGWTQISNSNPQGLTKWGDLLVVDFGTTGLFTTANGVTWTRIAEMDAIAMQACDSGLTVDFSGAGLLSFNGTTWSVIANWNAEELAALNLNNP